MTWWCILLLNLAIISFARDLQIIQFASTHILPNSPFVNFTPSVFTLSLFFFVIGMSGRVVQLKMKGEKERLKKKAKELERNLRQLQNTMRNKK